MNCVGKNSIANESINDESSPADADGMHGAAESGRTMGEGTERGR